MDKFDLPEGPCMFKKFGLKLRKKCLLSDLLDSLAYSLCCAQRAEMRFRDGWFVNVLLFASKTDNNNGQLVTYSI